MTLLLYLISFSFEYRSHGTAWWVLVKCGSDDIILILPLCSPFFFKALKVLLLLRWPYNLLSKPQDFWEWNEVLLAVTQAPAMRVNTALRTPGRWPSFAYQLQTRTSRSPWLFSWRWQLSVSSVLSDRPWWHFFFSIQWSYFAFPFLSKINKTYF